MRIGIDASALATPVAGIGRYTAEIIRALQPCGHDFFLYAHKPPQAFAPQSHNLHYRHHQKASAWGKLAWSQTQLPRWATQDRLDIFWGMAHRLPPCLPEQIPKIVTIHDLVWKHAPRTMRPLNRLLESVLMPRAIRRANTVIAVSNATAQDIAQEWPQHAHKTRIVYPGVKQADSHAVALPCPSELKLLGGRPFYLFVGTLEPRKNLERLLQAVARLPESIKNTHALVIAGGRGWGRFEASNTIRQQCLENHVILTGHISEEALTWLYQNTLFLVMPSLYEGFGFPLVEAMQHGKAVMTSCTSSMPEVAGKAGLLIDPYTIASIHAGLMQLLGNPELRHHLAQHAQKQALQFQWAQAAYAMQDIFSHLLTERKPL